jgi:hypothetical protein
MKYLAYAHWVSNHVKLWRTHKRPAVDRAAVIPAQRVAYDSRRLTFVDISSKAVRMAELVVVNDFQCLF